MNQKQAACPPEPDGQRRVALVHDWLTGMRGGEKVLEALCELHPAADIFTLFYTRGAVSETIERHRIHASALQALPGARRYYRRLLPLYPLAIEQFDLDPYDLVLAKITRNADRDRGDSEYLATAVPLDPSILRDRYRREMRDYLGCRNART